jgi:beta-glucosidase
MHPHGILGGRNFEYYSEDGYIGGKIGAAEVAGLQANGIYVYIKHMAMNDNDTNRDGNITWFSEQAAREIMLKDYEICVKQTYVIDDDETQTGHYEYAEGVLGIMASLNRDGISMFHPGLYRTILRNEWGYDGLVITDGVGPYPWVMSPGAGLFGGVEGQLGGSEVTTYYQYEGDATSTNYGKYLLRQTAKHLLYQVCHTGKLVRGETSVQTATPAWKIIRTVVDVVLAVLILLVVFVGFIQPVRKNKKRVIVTSDKEESRDA